MERLCALILAVALSGCAADVFGPYRQSISSADTREIGTLIAARPDIHKFVLRITASRSDCVYVETGDNPLDYVQTSFIACKRNGRWCIKEGSVQEHTTAIVT